MSFGILQVVHVELVTYTKPRRELFILSTDVDWSISISIDQV